jgi:hypothetical protein
MIFKRRQKHGQWYETLRLCPLFNIAVVGASVSSAAANGGSM